MISLPGYEIQRRIGGRVYLARRGSDGSAVVAKVCARAEAGGTSPAQREFDVVRTLGADGIPRALALERLAEHDVVISEYVSGASLRGLTARLGVRTFLSVSAALVRTVCQMHGLGWLHLAIRPEHVLTDAGGLGVRLVGLDAARPIGEPAPLSPSPPGALVYWAPELTGRLGRGAEPRSDVYGLGVLFYQLLCGEPPFPALEPRELITAHLAAQPRPLGERDPELPRPLVELVARMLRKAPEERPDATEVGRELGAVALDLGTEPGSPAADGASRVRAQRRGLRIGPLEGRARESTLLSDPLDRCCAGGGPLLHCVGGPEGVGKSALVRSLVAPAAERGARLAIGGVDPVHRDLPLSAFASVFGSLVEQVLAEGSRSAAAWRERIDACVGGMGSALLEVIPELAALLESSTPLPRVDPEASRERLFLAFERLLDAFASAESPLVMVLEDVRVSDIDSHSLLVRLLRSSRHPHLWIIATLDPAGRGNPSEFLQNVEQAGGARDRLHALELRALSGRQCAALAGRALGWEMDVARELLERLDLTAGATPLELRQALALCVDRGILELDATGQWHTSSRGAVSNGREPRGLEALLAARLEALDEDAREWLKLASCAGECTPPGALLTWVGGERTEAYRCLGELLERGLLEADRRGLCFAHAAVRRAALDASPPAERKRMHYEAGRITLAAAGSALTREARWAADQMNQAPDLLNRQERAQLSSLNAAIAHAALHAGALARADSHLRFARAFAAESDWEMRPEELLELYLRSAECALLRGDLISAAQTASVAASRARGRIERARVAAVRVAVLRASEGEDTALDFALRELRALGLRWARQPARALVRRELARTRRALARELRQPPSPASSAEEHTPGDDRRACTALLLGALIESARTRDPALFTRAIAWGLRTQFRRPLPNAFERESFPGGDRGHGAGLPLQRWLALYAGVRLGRAPGAAAAAVVSAAARHALRRDGSAPGGHLAAQLDEISASWMATPAQTAARLVPLCESAQCAGDAQAAWTILFARGALLFSASEDLATAARSFAEAEEVARGVDPELARRAREAGLLTQRLTGVGPPTAEGLVVPEVGDLGATPLQMLVALAHAAFAEWTAAFRETERLGQRSFDPLLGSALWAEIDLVHGLSAAVLWTRARPSQRGRYRRALRRARRAARRRARECPARFRDAALLLDAEWTRLRGRPERAAALFAAAHESAVRSQSAHVAWILERHAELARSEGRTHEARGLLERARALHRARGARAQQRLLSVRIAAFDSAELEPDSRHEPRGLPLGAFAALGAAPSANALAEQLLDLACDALPLTRARLWFREGTSTHCAGDRGPRADPAAESFPRAALEWVLRTGEPLRTLEAGTDGRLSGACLRAAGPVLCLPLRGDGEPQGALYLEPTDPEDLERGACAELESACAQAGSWLAHRAERTELRRKLRQREAELESLLARLHEALQGSQTAHRTAVDLLASISHEIRTPLAVVLGSLHTLQADGESRPRGSLEAIESAAQSLLQRVTALLELAQLESGALELEPRSFSLRELCEELSEQTAADAAQRGLAFGVFVDRHTPERVIGDRGRLRQAVSELLANALQFTARGRIDLRVSCPSGESGSARARVEVSDTGCGIPVDRLYNLFSGGLRVRSGSGAAEGVGLAIVRRLIERMGGLVGVRSSPGAGATFWCDWPLTVERPCEVGSYGLGETEVWVLTRQQRDAEGLCELLGSLGVGAHVLRDPAEAQAWLETPGADVKPLLFHYPPESQTWLCELRALRERHDPPLLALAVGGERSEAELAHRFPEVLGWPPRRRELAEALDRLAQRTARPETPPPAPRVEAPPRERAARPEPSPPRSSYRILLVEDYPLNQRLAVRLLRQRGYHCEVVGDGRQAVETYRAGEYDLILMDCQMPIMDGYEATRAIRAIENETGEHVPIIAVTANALPGDEERCIECGMDDYVAKPIVVPALYEAIERHLQKASGPPHS